jgi:nucleoside-diphosphate-sugar epimerase
MAEEHVLVTGALGCIGSWVVRTLVREDAGVTAFDLGSDPHRMRLIMTPEEIDRVHFVQGDITDRAALAAAMQAQPVTHIIHLAALQVPACKANPPLGARVNVVGTVNVFEAAREAGLDRVVYASSVAAYGPREAYRVGETLTADGLITAEAPLRPRTLYGVYKQADEALARVYAEDHGLGSVGLRPYVLYGPGRDQGMTSTPTQAMLAAAAGEPYHISYGGRCGMQYTDDVAHIFVRAARAPLEGAEVYNIRGSVVSMAEVVAAIEAAAPEVRGRITFEPLSLPFPAGQDDARLRAWLGEVPHTPLEEGVARTVATFRQALADGVLAGP